MSIDTAFDPTRPHPSNGSTPSTSLKEEPVPHLDEPAEEGARLDEPLSAQKSEGQRNSIDVEAIAERVFALDGKMRELVEKHPMRAIAVAAVAGFFIGRIASRI